MEALRVSRKDTVDIVEKGKSTHEKVEKTETEELIFGICTPIGSLKEDVKNSLKSILEDDYKYKVEVIRLSDFILEYQKKAVINLPGKTSVYSKLMHKINEGNDLRKRYQMPSILADLAIQKISLDRIDEAKSKKGDAFKITELESRRNCYIIDSIKNLEELRLFRKVYRDLFYQVSIFSSMSERQENLINKNLSQEEVKELIETDEFENNDFGQNVRNTFTNSDFFLRTSSVTKDEIKIKAQRFLHLIFESKIITPDSHEIAMYNAKSAAGNSSCLSRQVGACITDSYGDVISKGWNDVPKFGGNLYSEGDSADDRCFNKGFCSNDKKKDDLTEHILESLKEEPNLKSLIDRDSNLQDFVSERIRSSKVKDLIEFSRSVHAEMHAIIRGSQLSGNKMIGGRLYCTTYPCHNCARHIIVAGISEVYYIEPYVKSLCMELHEDAITEDESESNKVKILVFDGVAPRRYLEFFTKSSERKSKTGKLKVHQLDKIKPKSRLSLQALSTLEAQALHSLDQIKFFENEVKS